MGAGVTPGDGGEMEAGGKGYHGGVNFRMQRMAVSVQQIKAFGGGWDAAQIPSPKESGARSSPVSIAKY